MAKLNSIAMLMYYVQDLDKTAAFYEKLGFIPHKHEATMVSIRLNWFIVEFVLQSSENKAEFKEEANAESKGAGQFTLISVDDVDGYYKNLVAKGIKPSSEPRDWPYGRREFVVRDPDGYKLVFFTKTK